MALQLDRCGPEDMERAFTTVSEAFGNEHPYIDYVFPGHKTSAGRKIGGDRFLAMMNSDPHTTFLKAVDPETNTIVGVAKWNIYDGVIPAEVELAGEYWDSEDDKELAQEIFAAYLRPRRQAIKDSDGHLVSLDLMTVHPEHQRRGAGQMLLEWGLNIADDMGVKTVVEATRPGRCLYAKSGFEVEIEQYTAQLSDRFADRPTQSFTWMVRPAQQ